MVESNNEENFNGLAAREVGAGDDKAVLGPESTEKLEEDEVASLATKFKRSTFVDG